MQKANPEYCATITIPQNQNSSARTYRALSTGFDSKMSNSLAEESLRDIEKSCKLPSPFNGGRGGVVIEWNFCERS